MNEFKHKCIELAMKSNFRSKHGAVIVYDGHIIGSGFNVNIQHPMIAQYNEFKTLHAEMVAILRVKNKKLIKKSTLYVTRLTKDNESRMSKPCVVCMKLIKSFGVKEICYSDCYGNWITEIL